MGGPKSRAHIPLTEKEKMAMAFAFQCMSEIPKLDMEKWKDLAGYSTLPSANFAWGVIRAKLEYIAANGTSSDGSQPSAGTPTTPKKVTKRKKKGMEEDDDEEEAGGDVDQTPRKKRSPAKKQTGKAAQVKTEPVDDAEGESTDFLDEGLDMEESAEEA